METKIFLTEHDARLFMEFRRVQDTFDKLIQGGVLNMKNGQAIIHFDEVGTIKKIDLIQTTFKQLSTGA